MLMELQQDALGWKEITAQVDRVSEETAPAFWNHIGVIVRLAMAVALVKQVFL